MLRINNYTRNIHPFWWRSHYLAFTQQFITNLMDFTFYAEPTKTQDAFHCEIMLSTVKLCILIVISTLDHSLKLHNSALKKGCYKLLNIYRKCINNVKIWSISNDKEIETAIFQADSMILSATFKSLNFKNIVSFIMHLKDTHINNCHNKMWNNSDMFTSSIFWFSCCPK